MDKIYIKTIDGEGPSERRRRLARNVVALLQDDSAEGVMLRQEVNMLLVIALPAVEETEDPEFEEA